LITALSSDPITRGNPIGLPPRVAKKRQNLFESTGIAVHRNFGPGKGFIFCYDDDALAVNLNSLLSDQRAQKKETLEQCAGEFNLGYKIRAKEGYFPVTASRPATGHSAMKCVSVGEG